MRSQNHVTDELKTGLGSKLCSLGRSLSTTALKKIDTRNIFNGSHDRNITVWNKHTSQDSY